MISTGLCLSSQVYQPIIQLESYLVKGIQNIHVERAFVIGILGFGPLLGSRVEEVLTPQAIM